jgi:hypothetical protein
MIAGQIWNLHLTPGHLQIGTIPFTLTLGQKATTHVVQRLVAPEKNARVVLPHFPKMHT